MAEARLNASELARRTSVPPSSIKKIRNNDNLNPTLSTLMPLANFFSISLSQLVGDVPLNIENRQINETSNKQLQYPLPIISWNEAASWPNTSELEHNLIFSERSFSKNSFALITEETINERIPKGTVLLIDCDASPESSDYVLVIKRHQSKPSIKQILIEDDQIFLKSLQVENLVVPKSSDYKILGIVMEYRKYLK